MALSLSARDQFVPLDNIRSVLLMVVPSRLDTAKLRDGLIKLIEHHIPVLKEELVGDRRSKNLRYTPRKSTQETPFLWSQVKRTSTLGTSGLLSLATEQTRHPSFTSAKPVPQLEAEWTPRDWPTDRKSERSGMPLLMVHITQYSDATVIATSLPHATVDQLGYATFIRSWILKASDQAVPPFIELPSDAFQTLERAKLKRNRRFTAHSTLKYMQIMSGLIRSVVRHPKEERRTLFLPSAFVQDLRERQQELVTRQLGPDAPRISSGDVVAGLLCKLAFLSLRSPRQVVLSFLLNVRGRHPALPAGKSYLHNAFVPASTCVDTDASLSTLAYQHRLAVVEASSIEYIEESMHVYDEIQSQGKKILVGQPGALIYVLSNWCAAWKDLDFSPVVANEPGEAPSLAPSSPFPVIFGHVLERNHPTRFLAQIMSQAGGGFWCDFTAPAVTMRAIERLFVEDPMLYTL